MNGYTESEYKIAMRNERRKAAAIVHDCQQDMEDFIHAVTKAMTDPIDVLFNSLIAIVDDPSQDFGEPDDYQDLVDTQYGALDIGLQ